jgi:hypothetical protein
MDQNKTTKSNSPSKNSREKRMTIVSNRVKDTENYIILDECVAFG